MVRTITLVLFVLYGVCAQASNVTLTGLLEGYVHDGDFKNPQVWNTLDGDRWWNLWLIEGEDFNGAILNGPSNTELSLSVELTEGVNEFTMLGDFGAEGELGRYGLNLFFNGVNDTPGITVIADTDFTGVAPYPTIVTSSGNSRQLNGDFGVPSANSFVFVDGTTRVELLDYHWTSPDVYTVDRVGPWYATPDGRNDNVGSFTLRVSEVPEPCSLAMASVLFVAVLLLQRRSFGGKRTGNP